MLKIDNEKTKEQRQRFARQDCVGRHPDIHKAIEEVYAKDESIKAYGGSWMYSPSDSTSYEAVREIAREFAKKNHKKLAELNQQKMDVKSEMSQYEKVAKETSDIGYELQQGRRMMWKDVAKKLNIHQYMTGSGQLSVAKVRNKHKEDQAKVLEILDIYNKQYVPEVNRLSKEINQEAKKGKDLTAMREATDKYNDCVRRLNAIQSEINWWSGEKRLS